MSENVQYSYMFHVLAILCAQLPQQVKLSQGSTVSSNLAILGTQYSFELEGTLGVQDPSKG